MANIRDFASLHQTHFLFDGFTLSHAYNPFVTTVPFKVHSRIPGGRGLCLTTPGTKIEANETQTVWFSSIFWEKNY